MSREPPVAAPFDRHASSYDADCMRGLRLSGESRDYFARGRMRFLREWWNAQGLAEPSRVLDFGCGNGEGTAVLADAFPRSAVLGLDPSAASVEQAQARGAPRLSFAHDTAAGPLPPAALIHLSGVLHHVPPAERDAVFARIAAALQPGGVLALFDNNPLNPGTRLVMSRIPFDRDAVTARAGEACAFAARAGLRVLAVRYLFYFPRWLRWLRPLERFLTRVPLGAQYGVLAVRD